jgi:hypothetical protein
VRATYFLAYWCTEARGGTLCCCRRRLPGYGVGRRLRLMGKGSDRLYASIQIRTSPDGQGSMASGQIASRTVRKVFHSWLPPRALNRKLAVFRIFFFGRLRTRRAPRTIHKKDLRATLHRWSAGTFEKNAGGCPSFGRHSGKCILFILTRSVSNNCSRSTIYNCSRSVIYNCSRSVIYNCPTPRR